MKHTQHRISGLDSVYGNNAKYEYSEDYEGMNVLDSRGGGIDTYMARAVEKLLQQDRVSAGIIAIVNTEAA